MRNDTDLTAWLGEESSPRHGLPARCYIDDQFWALECKTVLSQGWVCAGFAHQLARPGDVAPVTIAGLPILLVRNRQGEIGAFHNAVRRQHPWDGMR